ncbi:MAG TPA: 50S ribosomal protein L21e, partial [Candidatus Nanoarchaeia archaeon]|nr:50S ribosomal protein L21e [Candidatus Nanoarchaeia archaeon]
LGKAPRNRGKFSLTRYFQAFKTGDKVLLKAEPSIHNGMYYRRFHARSGIITGKQGRCYTIQIQDLGKKKSVIVHPVHLRKA